MSYKESLLPITDDDRTFIRKQMKQIMLILSLIILIFGGFITAWCIYNNDWYIFLFLAVILIVVIIVSAFTIRRTNFNTRKDARKWVIEGELLEKREKTTVDRTSRKGSQSMQTDFFFIFENREVRVDNLKYNKYNSGDILHLEITEDSSIVLNITSISSISREEIIPETSYLSDYPETMSDDERGRIRKILIKRSAFVIIILAVVYIIITIINAIVIAYKFPDANETGRHLMVYGRYYLTAILAVLLFTLMISNLLSDYMSNLKRIIECKITDKVQSNVKLLGKNTRTSIQGDCYYLIVGKKLHPCTPEDFTRINPGDKVKIFKGNKSGYFLGIETIKSRS